MIESLFKYYYEYKFNKENSTNYITTTIVYIIILVLFPVSLHYNTSILYIVSLPIICVSYFLIILLILNTIYADEKSYGILLEYFFLSEKTKYLIVVIRLFIIWIYVSITMFFALSIAFVLFSLEYNDFFKIVTVIIAITPFLLFIGAISASLLIGVKEKNFFLSLLTLPFYIPILILTIHTLQMAVENTTLTSNYYIFIIFLTLSMVIAPKIIIYALKTWSE